jgi:hypothetical protein
MTNAFKLRIGLLVGVSAMVAVPAASAQPAIIDWEDLGCEVTCARSEVKQCKDCDEYDPRKPGRCLIWGDPYPCTKCVSWTRASDTCSSGTLAHNDRFEVSVEANAVPDDVIEFRLTTAWDVVYWKQLTVGSTFKIWYEDHASYCNWPDQVTYGCTSMPEWAGDMLAPSGSLTFNKAMGVFAQPQDVYVLKGLKHWLRPGDRVNFRWVQE